MTLPVSPLSQILRLTTKSSVRAFSTSCPTLKASDEDPILRTGRILKEEIGSIITKGPVETLKIIKDKPPSFCDVLIIGGGAVGLSTAYWLKQRGLHGIEVAVVERDPTVNLSDSDLIQYQKCTSTLSVAGIRQQFSLKENIELSLASAEFMRKIKEHLTIDGSSAPDIQFNPCGYSFLAGEESVQLLEDNVALQRSLGAKIDLLTPDKLKQKFPFINTEGIALASHGLENEGWFDPWSLLSSMKNRAIHLGTHYIDGEVTEISGAEQAGERRHMDKATIKLRDGKELEMRFSQVVIAAGCNSEEIGLLAGIGNGKGMLEYPIPVEPRKRFVYVVHCPDGPGLKMPFLVDNSGAYVRREGLTGCYLCGMSPPEGIEEPSVDNLDVDHEFFDNCVWPLIARRVPAFENLKVKSSWAGFYDFNRFDENGFVGQHPAFSNVFLATGFSGHGIQQSPAVGRAIAELILDGRFTTVDLSRFSFERYLDNEPLFESNIV